MAASFAIYMAMRNTAFIQFDQVSSEYRELFQIIRRRNGRYDHDDMDVLLGQIQLYQCGLMAMDTQQDCRDVMAFSTRILARIRQLKTNYTRPVQDHDGQ